MSLTFSPPMMDFSAISAMDVSAGDLEKTVTATPQCLLPASARSSASQLDSPVREVIVESPTVPWIVHSAARGLEVSKEARAILAPLPSPVCVALFYSNAAEDARRAEVVMRTLYPHFIPQSPSKMHKEGSPPCLFSPNKAPKCDRADESVVVRLWRKPLRVRVGDEGKKISVVVAEASPVAGLEEGAALALGLLLCSHMVFTGEALLEESHIRQLGGGVQALTRHVRTLGEGEEEDGLSFKQYFPRMTWLLQDFEGEMTDGKGNAISSESYLSNLLRVRGFSEDAEARNRVRTMLSAFFPQQDCLPLPPCYYRQREGSEDLLPNELLQPAYVAQLRALRQRVLAAPRLKDMQGVGVDGKMLSRLSEAYTASWNRAKVLCVRPSWTIVQRAKCGDALLKGIEAYRLVAIDIAKKCPCSDQTLLEANQDASRRARAMFQVRAVGEEKEAFREALEQRLQDLHRQLAVHNEASSRQVALELLNSLWRDAQDGVRVMTLRQFEDAKGRVTEEFGPLTKGLSRYSCRLALLEFTQHKLTELTKGMTLSPACRPEGREYAARTTPSGPPAPASGTPGSQGLVWDVVTPESAHALEFSCAFSPVVPNCKRSPEPEHKLDGLGALELATNCKRSPEPEHKHAELDGLGALELATWRTSSDGSLSVRPHGPTSPVTSRTATSRRDTTRKGGKEEFLPRGKDKAVYVDVGGQPVMVAASSPSSTTVCSMTSGSSASPGGGGGGEVSAMDRAVCERVTTQNKSVEEWLSLSLTPFEREKYGLAIPGCVAEGVAEEGFETENSPRPANPPSPPQQEEADERPLAAVRDAEMRSNHDSPADPNNSGGRAKRVPVLPLVSAFTKGVSPTPETAPLLDASQHYAAHSGHAWADKEYHAGHAWADRGGGTDKQNPSRAPAEGGRPRRPVPALPLEGILNNSGNASPSHTIPKAVMLRPPPPAPSDFGISSSDGEGDVSSSIVSMSAANLSPSSEGLSLSESGVSHDDLCSTARSNTTTASQRLKRTIEAKNALLLGGGGAPAPPSPPDTMSSPEPHDKYLQARRSPSMGLNQTADSYHTVQSLADSDRARTPAIRTPLSAHLQTPDVNPAKVAAGLVGVFGLVSQFTNFLERSLGDVSSSPATAPRPQPKDRAHSAPVAHAHANAHTDAGPGGAHSKGACAEGEAATLSRGCDVTRSSTRSSRSDRIYSWLSGDRGAMLEKGLLRPHGKEPLHPVRGQLFVDGEQLLVPDPALDLLRCECKNVRRVVVPRPAHHSGEWADKTLSVCMDCGQERVSREECAGLDFSGQGVPEAVDFGVA